MAGPDHEWLPRGRGQGGAQGQNDQAGGLAGHPEPPETPEYWFRRVGRLRRGAEGWGEKNRGGRLKKITYD